MAVATDIELPPDTAIGIVAAVEIRLGRAVVVIAEHRDGAIGIGNLVSKINANDMVDRYRALDHAVGRIRSLHAERRKRAETAQREEAR